jgi:hypothetical protein
LAGNDSDTQIFRDFDSNVISKLPGCSNKKKFKIGAHIVLSADLYCSSKVGG